MKNNAERLSAVETMLDTMSFLSADPAPGEPVCLTVVDMQVLTSSLLTLQTGNFDHASLIEVVSTGWYGKKGLAKAFPKSLDASKGAPLGCIALAAVTVRDISAYLHMLNRNSR